MEIKKKYQFVQNKNAKWQAIGLTKEGFYQGVVYKYGKVTPHEEDGHLRLQFEWQILDSNGLDKQYFKDDFFDLIGDILYDIMDEQLNDGRITICQQRKRLREQLSHT